MAQQRPGAPTDWKDKYLAALDEQEKRERSQQQLASLLMRAVVRLSLIADGVDETVDKQLSGLRQMLRDGKPSRRDLNTLVDALDGQVKRLDGVRADRARAIDKAFRAMVEQLRELGPERDSKQQLRKLDRSLKARVSKIYEYASLLKELAHVQQVLLQDSGQLRISKPFWHRWEPAGSGPAVAAAPAQAVADNRIPPEAEAGPAEAATAAESVGERRERTEADVPVEALANDGLDLADLVEQPLEDIDPATVGEEPPFSRLNRAVCAILNELLAQIETPPLARENYQAAKLQLDRGLNWYELVPVLENISIVVISAFDNHQKEFEAFLGQLNQRLSEAYEFIHTSQEVHGEGSAANRELRDSMQEQVSAMQQSVVSATSLDQLKTEVSHRLDQIMLAVDKHAESEKIREVSLSEQLDALVTRVKAMEAASEDVEQRIEEQRQKALLDVLTQLPNREAYGHRLDQEYARWARYKRPLTLAVVDVDYFKRINDTYGHLAGDKVLRIIAKTLRKRLRKTDFIARYGGEEFVLLLPETEEQAAHRVLEGVREAIANCPFHFKDQPVKITASFGLSEFREGDVAEAVFSRADKALYQAKEQGRNRCLLAPRPESEPE